MTKVHFVYNKGIQLKTPQRITHEIAKRVGKHYPIAVYDPGEKGTIHPADGDILLGHPSRFDDSSLFNRAFRESGWSKRIVFCPFSHGMPLDGAGIDPLVEEADAYLALCGPYWFETMDRSLFSHWSYKTMRCDLGIDLHDYPRIKTQFNPPGQRRFVYIGNAGAMKGVDYFCELSEANPGLDFHWIGGTGQRARPSGTLRRNYFRIERRLLGGPVTAHGAANWRSPAFRNLVSSFDFLLTCGRSDSNPTTVLEATAWGLIPIATQQCGFPGGDWLPMIPLDNVKEAGAILHRLNTCPEAELLLRQEAGLKQLRESYTWDHAAQQVLACIESPTPTPPLDAQWIAAKARNQAVLRAIVRHYKRAQVIEDRFHALKSLLRRKLATLASYDSGSRRS